MSPQLRPPFSYYGGKQRLARRIVSLMPEHRCYIEPFFGSGAVLMAKPRSRFELVNDLDGGVTAFWRCLRDRPDELERVCALTPHSRPELVLAADDHALLDDLERARRFWTVATQTVHRSPRRASPGRWSVGGHASTDLLSFVGRFAAVAERMRGVSVDCRPAEMVVRQHARTTDAVVYADPPYPHIVRERDSSREYRVEMSGADHVELLEALVETPATVILSGYACDLYDDALAGWATVDIGSVSGAGNGARRVERLWVNRPELVEAAQLTLDEGVVA